jgi:hypothetical protein
MMKFTPRQSSDVVADCIGLQWLCAQHCGRQDILSCINAAKHEHTHPQYGVDTRTDCPPSLHLKQLTHVGAVMSLVPQLLQVLAASGGGQMLLHNGLRNRDHRFEWCGPISSTGPQLANLHS